MSALPAAISSATTSARPPLPAVVRSTSSARTCSPGAWRCLLASAVVGVPLVSVFVVVVEVVVAVVAVVVGAPFAYAAAPHPRPPLDFTLATARSQN